MKDSAEKRAEDSKAITDKEAAIAEIARGQLPITFTTRSGLPLAVRVVDAGLRGDDEWLVTRAVRAV